MKKVFLALAIILMTTAFASAAEVTLEWDPNNPAPAGYRLYARQGATYDYQTPIWQGQEITATVTVPDDSQTAFVVRAYIVGNIDSSIIESDDSNEVIFTPDTMKPPSPNGLLLKVIENLTKAIENLTEYLKAVS